MRLENKVVLITGAARGIGKAAAALFAREGAKVVIADIDAPAVESAVQEMRGAGLDIRSVLTDVSDPQSVQAAISSVVAQFGRLDVLYNNAGGSRREDSEVTTGSVESFWKTLQIEVFGTWLTCKYAIPEFINGGGGVIVNTSSIVALLGYGGKDAYTAAKGAIAALTRSMAVEYGRHKIRVNAVAPGVTLSERVLERTQQGLIPQDLMSRHLVGLLDPAQIAQAALFLASDASSGMTGHVMPVDSGATIS